MIDYAQSLERLEKALGENFKHSSYILGVPGTSLALKVDPFYYLAIQPGFTKYLARWAGMFPDKAALALVKTGNMLSDVSHTVYTTPVAVFAEGASEATTVGASFILADFIDKALIMHGGQTAPLPVSGLKIVAAERLKLDFLFQGKTPLQALAFGNP